MYRFTGVQVRGCSGCSWCAGKLITSHLVLSVEHEQQNHLVSVHTEDVFLSLAPLAASSALLLLVLLLLPEEEGVKVGRAGAGLQGQD